MIVAVDFDGILCENAFPDIGKPNYGMISFVRQLIDEGHEVVLWTSRTGDRLTEAVAWCKDRGLHFCAVNENAPSNLAQYAGEYPTPSPKVYADLYLEDRCPWFIRYEQCLDHNSRNRYARTIDKLIDHTRKSINKLEDERRRREEREARISRPLSEAHKDRDLVVENILEGASDD